MFRINKSWQELYLKVFLVKLMVDSSQLYEEKNFHPQVFLKIFITVFWKKCHSILDDMGSNNMPKHTIKKGW